MRLCEINVYSSMHLPHPHARRGRLSRAPARIPSKEVASGLEASARQLVASKLDTEIGACAFEAVEMSRTIQLQGRSWMLAALSRLDGEHLAFLNSTISSGGGTLHKVGVLRSMLFPNHLALADCAMSSAAMIQSLFADISMLSIITPYRAQNTLRIEWAALQRDIMSVTFARGHAQQAQPSQWNASSSDSHAAAPGAHGRAYGRGQHRRWV